MSSSTAIPAEVEIRKPEQMWTILAVVVRRPETDTQRAARLRVAEDVPELVATQAGVQPHTGHTQPEILVESATRQRVEPLGSSVGLVLGANLLHDRELRGAMVGRLASPYPK